MDMNELKKAVEQITMPEDMQERIVKGVKEDMKHGQVKTDGTGRGMKRCFKTGLVIAAAVASLVTVIAVGGKYGSINPTIVENMQTLREYISQNDISSYSVVGPNSRTPHSLEEMIESRTFKDRGWLSEETMNGSVRSDDQWESMEVVQAEGDIKKRYVYATNGAVKTEYTARKPGMLQDVMTGDVRIDLAGLDEAFQWVPNANLFYEITEKNRKEVGTYCDVLYQGEAEGSFFALNCTNTAARNQNENAYIPADAYDQIYHYTNAAGIEFIIKVYGDCVWAESIMEHSEIGLYGGYMRTDEIEKALEYVYLAQ